MLLLVVKGVYCNAPNPAPKLRAIRKANNFYGYGSVLSRDGISRAISPDKGRMSGISRGGVRSPQALRDNNIILNSPEAIEVERRYTKIL